MGISVQDISRQATIGISECEHQKTHNQKNIEMTGHTGLALLARKVSPPFVLALSALLFGILSGLRWPNLWSMTHFLFDYSSGFIKRGLVGEVLSLVYGQSVSYGVLATLSFGIFAVWVFMLFLRLRMLAKFDYRIWLVTAVVLISPGFVFLVHEIGYFDHIGLVVVFLCFLMSATLAGLLARIVLCGVMVVTHESFFLMFFPAVALEFWIRTTLAGNRGRFATMLILVAVTATITYEMGQNSLPDEQEVAFTNHVTERAGDFAVRQDAVATLFRDGRENFIITLYELLNQVRWTWAEAAVGGLFLLPLPIGMVLTCLYIVRRTPLPDRDRLFLYAGIIFGSFSPLLLNVLAVDLWRFFAVTQISAFVVLIAVIGQLRTTPLPRPWIRPAGYILATFAVIGAATDITLFDGYTVAKPPFLPHVFQLIDVLQGDVPWVQIPSR